MAAWIGAIGSLVGGLLPVLFGDDEGSNKQTVDYEAAHWGEMEWYEQAILKAWYNWLWGYEYTDPKTGETIDPMSYLEMLEAQQKQQKEFSEQYLDKMGDITRDYTWTGGVKTDQFENDMQRLARDAKKIRYDVKKPDMGVNLMGNQYDFVSRPKRAAAASQLDAMDRESKNLAGGYGAVMDWNKDKYGAKGDLAKDEYDKYMKYFIDVAPELAFFEKISQWAQQMNSLRYGGSAGSQTSSSGGGTLQDMIMAMMGAKMGGQAVNDTGLGSWLSNLFNTSGSSSSGYSGSGSSADYSDWA